MKKNPIDILLMKEEFNDRLVSNVKLGIFKKNILIINQNKSYFTHDVLCFYITFLLLLIVFFFISVFFFTYIIFILILFAIIVIILITVYYLIFEELSPNWIVDRDKEFLTYEKTYLRRKKTGEVKFSEVLYIVYYHSDAVIPGTLKFVVNFPYAFHSIKDIVIYTGRDDDCKRLGTIIAEFIKKSFYYQTGNFREKLY